MNKALIALIWVGLIGSFVMWGLLVTIALFIVGCTIAYFINPHLAD